MRSNFAKARKMLEKADVFFASRKWVRRSLFGEPQYTLDKLRVVSRCKELRDLEGKYPVTGYWGDDLSMFEGARAFWTDRKPSKYCSDGSRLSQMLIRKVGCDPNRVAKFIENLGEREIVFSCKATDIVRMSVSKHFTTCLDLARGGKRIQTAVELSNPDVALVYIPDRGGDMLARCLVRLLVTGTGQPVLGLQKVYGNGMLVHSMIKQALQDKIRVESLVSQTDLSGFGRYVVLESHCRVYNLLYRHLPWVDVSHRVICEGDGGFRYVFNTGY